MIVDFKIGDKVVCIDDTDWTEELTKGKAYTVLQIFQKPDSWKDVELPYIFAIEIRSDSNVDLTYKSTRFTYLEEYRNNIIDGILG